MRDLEPRLFGYIWRHSRRDQLALCLVVLGSLPFYFASLDLPRRIVNDAITGRAFKDGSPTTTFLDLTIPWPTWLGGGSTVVFPGFTVGQMELLFSLSFVFLFLVLINGAFKFHINLTKGILGERMLRRLRFQLFSLMLRFTPEATRGIKSSETATIIRDEVEPIGAFIGNAIVVPAFLGTQAATALAFILMQNLSLGLVAGAIVGVQIVLIPRLRREIIRLSRQRQIASRSFAGRVGEVLDGLDAVTVNDTGRWERAEIGGRLYGLYDLRLRIYRRKFLVKYLNNLLAQVTPFLFYAIGGMFALRGQLDIGQLVAVLAAYRDLPPPLKELIDWDQQRLDVEVKYETVAAHFAPQRLRPAETDTPGPGAALGSPLRIAELRLTDPHGGPPLDVPDACIPLPTRLAVLSPGSERVHLFARVLAGLATPQGGSVRIGAYDLSAPPQPFRAQRIAACGPEPILFPGSIRENILYGLRRRPPAVVGELQDGTDRRLVEARLSGNPVERADGDWIDYAALGLADAPALELRMLDILERLGLGEDLYQFGLAAPADTTHDTAVGGLLIAARIRLRTHFTEGGMASLVVPFDAVRYNPLATMAENLLFGVACHPTLTGRELASEPRFRSVLVRLGLFDDLARMGVAVGRTLVEIFRDVPPGHPLFGRFCTIASEDLPEYGRRLTGITVTGALSVADSQAFLGLALSYVEPRQRLGLLKPKLMDRVVAARAIIRSALEGPDGPHVDPYDPHLINTRSSILDNVLFGRIDTARTHGEMYIQEQVRSVMRELDLEPSVRLRGLDHAVGIRGRQLTTRQQAAVDLTRAILRQPEILVVDGTLTHLGCDTEDFQALLAEVLPHATLIATVANQAEATCFPSILNLNGPERDIRF